MRSRNFLKIEVYKTIEEDSYENGCIPETFKDLGHYETFNVFNHDPLNALKEIKERGYNGTPMRFGKALIVQQHENSEGVEANKYLFEDWIHSKQKLFLATYSFYFTTVIETAHTEQYINHNFENLEEA